MSCLCPWNFIEETGLKVYTGCQRRLDLRHSNRILEMIFTCLLWLAPVDVAAADLLWARGARIRRKLDQFDRSHVHLSPSTLRRCGSQRCRCSGRMTGDRTYERFLRGGPFAFIEIIERDRYEYRVDKMGSAPKRWLLDARVVKN